MATAVEMATTDKERGGGGGGAPESDPRIDVARTRETKRQQGGGMSESARGPASLVVEVGEGAPVVGTPTRAHGRASGAQTLASAACGKAAVGERWMEVQLLGEDGGGQRRRL